MFALERKMIFWVNPHGEAVPPMFAALWEDVWPQFPLKADCAYWARNVVHLVRVIAIVAGIAQDYFRSVRDLERKKSVWEITTLTIPMKLHVFCVAAHHQQLKSPTRRKQADRTCLLTRMLARF